MTKHPFTNKNLKSYVSGIDIKFDTENMNDSLIIAANDIRGVLLPAALYDELVNFTPTEDPAPDPAPEHETEYTEAQERLRYAMAPLALFHHFIWLQVRVSNNGITTYKGQNETTAFKYQTDEIKENLLTRHGVFFKELIDYLEEAKYTPEGEEEETFVFTNWGSSAQKTEMDALLIKNYRDFDNYFKIEGNAAFFIRSRIIQQEAYDEINAHIKIATILAADPQDAALIRKLKKALAYLTVARATFEWDQYYLPLNVQRIVISVNSKEYEDNKRGLSAKYQNYAMEILRSIDIQKEADQAEIDYPEQDINLTTPEVTEDDKHYLMM